jgi:hypothetical protein
VNPPKQRWKCKSAECGREFTWVYTLGF